MATLSEFLKSGKLGDIHYGMLRDQVVAILGQPNDTSVAQNPLILKYGGLQLTFFKPTDAEHRELSQIGLHYGPSWEPIPAPVLPSDFVGNPETTRTLEKQRTTRNRSRSPFRRKHGTKRNRWPTKQAKPLPAC
jgi:hypothetical protein